MSSQRSQQMQQQREVTINSRVESNGVVGTVKYIGPVVGTQGTWVGVDWDIPEKGKNDGSYKNVRYFTTSFPSSGSFLRLTKLNTGRSFFEALIDRYENNVIAPSESLLTLAQRSGNNRVIEYVGFDKVSEKQKEFDQLLQLDLSKQYVSYAGDVSAANLSAVQHLDLSANLLSSWSVVADIVKHLPSLNSLVLSANRLVAENCSQLAPCFDKVKTLVYGKANYTWNDVVVVIGKLFRHIENLDVWGNAITKITTPPNSVFQELKSLNLSDNKLKDWSMVCKLGNLPLLESLQLVNCEISEIEFGDNLLPTKETHLFSSLKSLNLARNQIKKWTSIAQLNRLSSLEELFIKNNPVFDEE
ncbi:tubulin-specific chaperone E-like isoform X2, partial [Dinothrombium tinctorium]